MKYKIAFFIFVFISYTGFAQRTKNAKQQKAASDTALPPRTVIVTSEFAPALKPTPNGKYETIDKSFFYIQKMNQEEKSEK